ncbi:unnamed protein product, partial [Polarella glacialis]
MAVGCVDAFWQRHIFFKTHSASLWKNGPWTALQQEGYPSHCLDGGGRFYFAALVSNVVSTDLGVCVPAVCNYQEITWDIFPALYQAFFNEGEQIGLQFAVQLSEYTAWGYEHFLTVPQETRWGLALVLLLAVLGLVSGRFGAREASLPRGAFSRAQYFATFGIAIGEVMLFTRWAQYAWLEDNSHFYAGARRIGVMAAECLPGLRLVRLAAATSGAGRGSEHVFSRLRAGAVVLVLRLLQLAMLSLLCVGAANLAGSLTVNRFSGGAWKRGWLESLQSCLDLPPEDMLLGGILSEGLGPRGASCLHLATIRDELRLLAVAAPVLLLSAGLGPLPATLAGFCAAAAWSGSSYSPELAVASASVLAAYVSTWGRGASGSPRAPMAALLALAALASAAYFWAHLAFAGTAATAVSAMAAACLVPLVLGLAGASASRAPAASVEEPALQWLPCRSADMALPALPLVLYVLEGYIEPHAKVLTLCDFLARLFGVFALAMLGGAACAATWAGICRIVQAAVAAAATQDKKSLQAALAAERSLRLALEVELATERSARLKAEQALALELGRREPAALGQQ